MKFLFFLLLTTIFLLANVKQDIFTLYQVKEYKKACQLSLINLNKNLAYQLIDPNNAKINNKLYLISDRDSRNVAIEELYQSVLVKKTYL
jgi:hypothetical protein